MEFIVALFGLIYYMSKAIDNVVQNNRFERKLIESNERYEEVNERWKKAVVDTELEKELWKYVTFGLNYEKVLEEISPVLQMFPSLSRIEKLCFNSADAKNYYCLTGKMAQNAADIDRSIALRILMAKRGKLLYDDACFCVKKNMISRCDYDDFIDFLFWIKSQLKLHGVDEELVIKQKLDYYYLNESTRDIIGNIYWYPTVSRTDLIKMQKE